MTKCKTFIKNNYQFLLAILLLILIFIVAINPAPYMNSTLKGFTVWAKIVLPSLFCFYIFTKLLLQTNKAIHIFNFLNKPFEKLYKTKKVGGYVFIMSLISGYPLGANLIYEFYSNKVISKAEAKKMLSYCSTSGPMFIIGSLASGIFFNMELGIVVLVSHIISALLNGLLYRNIKEEPEICEHKDYIVTKDSLNTIVYNAIISALMVGGYIALSFTILEIFSSLNLVKPLSSLINLFLPKSSQFGESIIKGIVEMTNGCVSISEGTFSLRGIAITLSGLISFGGLSIHLQSYIFFSKCDIKYKYFLKLKITQTIIAVIISSLLSILIL